MRDITKPEAKRVRKLLSALINFAKFREMQLAGVDAVLERTETTQAQLSKVEAENAELAARLEAARADKAAEAPMIESLQAEVDGLLEQLHEMNAQQQQLQHDSRDAKDQCTELTDSEASLIFEIKAIQQEWCVPPQPSPLQAPARCRQQSRAAFRCGRRLCSRHSGFARRLRTWGTRWRRNRPRWTRRPSSRGSSR